MTLPINSLYTESFQHPTILEQARKFWGDIPGNIQELGPILVKLQQEYSNSILFENKTKEVISLTHQYHKKHLGITKAILTTLEDLPNGVIESAHQPVILGGPAFIFNKLACTNTIARVHKLSPIFFVGDYDQIQSELTNMRVPSTGNTGTLLTVPVEEDYQFSPISKIPLPPEDWLESLLDTINENYNNLIIPLTQEQQNNLIAHKDHINHIIRTSYYHSQTIAEWSSGVLNSIINEYLGLGIPFLVSSQLRPLYQDAFEFLVANKNRVRFIDAINSAYTQIQELGYRPGMNQRSKEYAPFFYECPNKTCHHARIELSVHPRKQDLHLEGICPSCLSQITFEISKTAPDLTDHIEYLSPRVDSRQILVSSIIPILTHISGPGETSYYAQVIPAMRTLNIPKPVIFRYIRNYYNSRWNELQGKELEEHGFQGILGSPLFKLLRKWGKATKNQNTLDLQQTQLEIQTWIHESRSQLNQIITENSQKIDHLKEQSSETAKKTLETLILQQNLLLRYLTNIHGQYAPEKSGQEVVFSWIDWGITAGIRESVEFYNRIYSPATPPIGYYFLNLR